MATLFAIVYPDLTKAEQAAATLRGLSDAGFLAILDSSLVSKDEKGDVDHHGERHTTRRGAVTGAVLGGLTGAIFFVPVLGVAAGAAVGGYFGKQAGSGSGNDFEAFRDQVGADLQPGGAALLVLGQTDGPDRIIKEMGRHGGTVRSTDVSDQQLADIQAEIDKVSAG